MRMWLCLVSIWLVASCGVPSRYFRDEPATRVSVEGSVFDVRVRGDLAESVRINSQYAPRMGPIGGRAAVAMRAVSGCKVVGILGDQAVQLGELDCGDGRRTPDLRAVPPSFDCLEIPSGVQREDGTAYFDYDCTPYWR